MPVGALRAPLLQHRQLLATGMVGIVARHDLGVRVIAREGRAHDHAGVVAEILGQAPAIEKLGSPGCCLVTHDQRDAGIAQGVDSSGNRQACHAIERGDAIGRDTEFAFQIELTAASGELNRVANIVDQLERRLAVLALQQARDVLVDHSATEAVWNGCNELIAVQQTGDVGVVEDVIGAGQTDSGAGDDHGLALRRRLLTVIELPSTVEHVGKHASELVVTHLCW